VAPGLYPGRLSSTLSDGSGKKGKLMDFSDALREMKNGKRVMRTGWYREAGSGGLWIEYAGPASDGRRSYEPALLVRRDNGKYVTFPGSHIDLLADDWEAVE
jgi:Protein of unknown function (DUF2829)